MKRCPQCRRDYYDDSLLYCLDDGAQLVNGPAAGMDDKPAEAIIPDLPSEAPTRRQIHSTEETAIIPSPTGVVPPIPRKVRRVAALVLTLTLVGTAAFLGYRYFTVTDAERVDSLAVLPLENGTGDPGLDYLSDGLSESLIDKLSQLPGMRVIARSSSFKYRGSGVNVQEVATKLNVDAVVMGKVAKIGDRFTIRVEVVDGSDNKQLWGEQYVRDQADLVSLQQDVSRAVSQKLQLRLTGAQTASLAKSNSINPAAYELFLRGRYAVAAGGNDNYKKALELYLQAVEVDPNFALAFAHIAHTYTVLSDNAIIDPAEGLPKAAEAAHKAVELNDLLAESHMALGRLHRKRWNWQGAETELKRAIELNPNLSSARRNYAMYLSTTGRHDEAVREMAMAREVDPLSLAANAYVAYPFLFARRYEEGIEAARRASLLDPKYAFAHFLLAYNYAAAGRHREAIEAYEKAHELGDRSVGLQIYLGASYAGLGEKGRAMEILEKIRDGKAYYSPAEFAILLTALEMKDEALTSLEQAFANRDPQLEYLKVESGLDPLRDDPRYVELVRKIGFPE